MNVEIKTRYIIATSPRTGSTLLCEALTATEVSGYPKERFDPGIKQSFITRLGPYGAVPFAEYFATVLRRGTTNNGVFGVKLHWSQVKWLAHRSGCEAHNVLEALFPDAQYIRLVRRDLRAQAISLYRLDPENRYRGSRQPWILQNSSSPSADRRFDCTAIRQLEANLQWQKNSWIQFFADRHIDPLTIEYESLASNLRHEVARVLGFLGQDTAISNSILLPNTARRADETTAAWRRLMDTEDVERAILDK